MYPDENATSVSPWREEWLCYGLLFVAWLLNWSEIVTNSFYEHCSPCSASFFMFNPIPRTNLAFFAIYHC